MLKRKYVSNEDNSSKLTSNKIITSLQEKDVFISEYINPFPGYPGILKMRYSDFQVNEIDLDGNIIHLTDLTVPKFSSFIPKVQHSENELTLISKDYWDQLRQLFEGDKSKDAVCIEVTHFDKNQRQQLHHLIRSEFNNELFSSTVSEGNDRKIIKVGKNKKDNERNSWIDTMPKYLYFVLYKENMDSTEVISNIASKLRLKANMIMQAGTKDRRGKTVQRIAIRCVKSDKFVGLRLRNTHIGNFSYKDAPLKLGDLRGNRFRVVLRDVPVETDNLPEIMRSIKHNGFINYFGLQRFGASLNSPTYEIGKCLLRKEWKRAIELILLPRINDFIDIAEAKRTWRETGNSKAAVKSINRSKLSIEGKILQALAVNGDTAYINALQTIPRNMMFLYGHSYQSLVWNKVVTRRIKEFGLKPLCGDLVFTKNELSIPDITELDENEVLDMTPLEAVRPITESELLDIKIEDIVYPLPGFSVQYPKNVLAEFYQEILKEDEVNPENFKQSSWLFSIPGSYRKLITIPQDFNWSLINYNNPQSDLVLSDLDVLQGKKLDEDGTGPYRALFLEFSLPSCSYATMAIREITKQDTSVSYQSSLTNDRSDYSQKTECDQ